MGKKHKKKKEINQTLKPNFIETHWDKIIVILLLLLPLIYFASFLNPDKMIAGSDYLLGGYPFEKWTEQQAEMPLWYPHVFGGVPVLGSPVGGSLAPLAQLRAIIAPNVVLAITFIIFFFLAALGTFLYLKEIGLSKYSAALGAVVYQFIGNLATTPNAGHAGRAASIALFPLMLFCVHRGLNTRKFVYFILTALVTAFAFYEGHFQITYYGLLLILAYVIYYIIAKRKQYTRNDYAKVIGYGIIALVFIFLLMAAVWLPVLGGLGTVARGVERGYEYAISWSMPPSEIIDLVIPTYSGLLDNYWGFNSFKIHLEYFGLVALIFSLLAIILYWKKQYVKFFTVAVFMTLFIALGGHTPVFRIFYAIIPGFKLTRAPSLIFYLISFGVVVLGAIGFENIVINRAKVDKDPSIKKKLWIVGGIIVAGLFILAVICSASKDSIIRSAQQSLGSKLNSEWGGQIAQMKLSRIAANYPDFVNGIWRSLVFAVVIFVLIFLAMKQKVKIWILVAAAMAIALIDQLPLVSKYLPAGPAPQKYYTADEVTRFINKDKGIFRVFPSPWYEHTTDLHLLYHNIQSAGGYIPNPIQRYQEYIGAGTSVMFRPPNLLQYPQFMDMLNIKYLIGPTLPADISQYDAQTQRAIEEIRIFFSRYKLVYNGQRYSVYLNENTLPRAYIVYDYEVLSGLEILDRLKSPDFNPGQTVILEHDPHISFPETQLPNAVPKIVSYEANKVVCAVESNSAGILVLTDNWHPDWKVFVDGEEKKLYRANYTFRAVPLEPGKHEVVFAYISGYFNIGRIISIIAFVLAIAFCAVALKKNL
ncbi:MAG: YfhO family protein [bacterium]